MPRATLLLIALLLAALVVVVGSASGLVRSEVRALERSFVAERRAELERITREVRSDLDDVGNDLSFAADLVRQASSDETAAHGLNALLGSVRPYRAARIYEADGTVVTAMVDPRGIGRLPERAEEVMAETAHAALEPSANGLTISRPLGEDRFRAFAIALDATERAPRRTLALLVDTLPIFEHIRLLNADALLLGPHGLAASVSSAKLRADVARADHQSSDLEVFAQLLAAIRKGESGSLQIPAAEAVSLGFEDADLVVQFATIPVRGGGGAWKLAIFNSTRALTEQARAVLWRFASGALSVAVVLVVVGAYLVVSSVRGRVLSERLQRAGDLVQLNEISLRIIDHIPVGVLALAGDGRILVMNRDLRVRLPEAQIGTKLERALFAADQPTRDRLLDLVEAARASHEVQYIHAEALDLFGYAGRFSIHAIPLDEARLLGARTLLVIEDVTALERLSSQLMRAEKLATVGVLAAGIAHELGTPLGVVRGRAEYIQLKLGASHPQYATAAIIIDEIDRVTRTIRQLLDFSRIRPAVVAPVSLEAAVRRVVELLRIEAERRSVEVAIEVHPPVPLVAANADQLEQVIANLVINAYDACIDGGRVEIRIGAAADEEAVPGGPVRLTVSDDGCGMTPEQIKRAFDPFYTTKKRGQGTGLGLAVVEQMVRNHGAQVELVSTPGKGTTVTLLWPVAEATERASAVREEVEIGAG